MTLARKRSTPEVQAFELRLDLRGYPEQRRRQPDLYRIGPDEGLRKEPSHARSFGQATDTMPLPR